MQTKPYSSVAAIYDYLMNSIDYGSWADYIYDIAVYSGVKITNVLEIAAGTGKLAAHLKDRFQNFFLTDISLEMLKRNNDSTLPKVCCDMKALPFKKKFDFVFSTFDSVNYLMTKDDLRKFFLSVKNILAEDGLITFDVSLEPNSLKHLRYLNRHGEVNGITFTQISKYDKRKRIHMNRFIFEYPDGKKLEEVHKQRIYTPNEIFEVLETTGFYAMDCFETFTFRNINPKSERAQFLIKHGR
jgi:SAM-dependent methyltransferase